MIIFYLFTLNQLILILKLNIKSCLSKICCQSLSPIRFDANDTCNENWKTKTLPEEKREKPSLLSFFTSLTILTSVYYVLTRMLKNYTWLLIIRNDSTRIFSWTFLIYTDKAILCDLNPVEFMNCCVQGKFSEVNFPDFVEKFIQN